MIESLFEKYVIPTVGVLCFLIGLYVAHIWHVFQEAKDLRAIQEHVVEQQAINNKVIENLQTANMQTEEAYNILKDKLHATKVTNVPCTLTADAIKLWNQSSHATPSVPPNSPRTPEASVETNPIAGVGIELAIKNKIENDKLNEDNRQQLEAIIQWNKITYGR